MALTATADRLTREDISGHLCNLYAQGNEIDLWQIVPEELYNNVSKLIDTYAESPELEEHEGRKALAAIS